MRVLNAGPVWASAGGATAFLAVMGVFELMTRFLKMGKLDSLILKVLEVLEFGLVWIRTND